MTSSTKADKAEKENTAATDELAPAPAIAPPSVHAAAPGKVDRSVYVGPVNRRALVVKFPASYVDPSKAPAGETVDIFQVLSSTNAVLLRFDGHAHLLDVQQAAALKTNLAAALANVSY